jgi:8-oxo-dGTP diphosphatase
VRPLERVWDYTRPDGELRLYWWRAELLDNRLVPNPAEIAELRWLTPAEILALPDLLDGNRVFLATLRHDSPAF